jgi:hypothetical protein
MLRQRLQPDDLALIDKSARARGNGAADATRAVNQRRAARGVAPIHQSAVYMYVKGISHPAGATETRGRKRVLTPKDADKLDRVRKRLVKAANNQYRVTYADVVAAADMEGRACQRTCEEALRSKGVRFRQPRKKILLTEEDAKVRVETLKAWLKRPKKYWQTGVHAWVDNKSWVMPLTPKQRAKYRQTLITGHLRKPSEGTEKGMTKPRQNHSFLGIPSVCATAAVAKDRVILWHAQDGKWNGQKAADTYSGQLLKALRRTWGPRKSYTIVEDGGRKGNQSQKGIDAKSACGIKALTLPPRTPSVMPLDFSIWKAIEKRLVQTAPKTTETKDAFLQRLKSCAQKLPKNYVKSVIARMRPNMQDIVDADGYAPKND